MEVQIKMLDLVHSIRGPVCVLTKWITQHNSTLVSLSLFVAVLLVVRLLMLKGTYKQLPGPWGLPIVGYLPFLTTSIHKRMLELSLKYGPIFQVNFGNKPFVFLADPRVIKEAFAREEFHARPSNALYDMFDGYGLINSSGDAWKSQRKFIHRRLGSIRREQMQDKIMNEVENVLQCLSSGNGMAMDVGELFCNASTNVVCSILMGVRFQPNYANFPNFKRLMALYEEGFKLFMKCDITNYIPATKFLPNMNENFERLSQLNHESGDLIRDIIQNRRKSFDPNHCRDILDSYLLEEFQAKKDGTLLFEGKDFERQLVQTMKDLFSAGEETVKTCLLWGLIHLLHNPGVARRVQEEIDTIVGRSRRPSLEDQRQLPYTEAVLCEILRRSNVVPLGTSHATSKDTHFGNYFIKKNTTVIPLIYACHMSPQLWTNPERFDPLRFLDTEGRVNKPDHFLPFGVGRRMCLGLVLARSELFLFFTSILHTFNIANPPDEDLPSLEGIMGSTLTPNPFKICFIPRDIDMRPYECRTAGL